MTKVVIKKLGPPFILLILFVSFTLLSKDLLLQFGSEAIGQSQKVLVYVIQIGIWLSAAPFHQPAHDRFLLGRFSPENNWCARSASAEGRTYNHLVYHRRDWHCWSSL